MSFQHTLSPDLQILRNNDSCNVFVCLPDVFDVFIFFHISYFQLKVSTMRSVSSVNSN